MRTLVVAVLLMMALTASAFNSSVKVLKPGSALTDTIGIGQPAVPFMFTSPDGEVLSSEKLKGKVLVLDFWATWCAPCRKLTHEIDSGLAVYHARQDFLILGVDFRETKKEAAVAYWKEHGYTFPMASDDVYGKLINAGNPTIVVIDKKGVVRGRWDRYTPKVVEEVKKVVVECVAEGDEWEGMHQ